MALYYYHLALAHYRAGHTPEAQRAMRLAREKETGFSKKQLHPLERKDYDALAKALEDQ